MRCVCLLLTLMVAVQTQGATEIEYDVMYQGGTELAVAEYGVSLTVPPGWRAKLPMGSEFLVMEPVDGGVTVFATGLEGSMATVRAMMSARIDLGDGFALEPTGTVSADGSTLANDYTVIGSDRQLVAKVGAHVGDYGATAVFALLGPSQSIASYLPAFRQLQASTKLAAPRGSEATQPLQQQNQQQTSASGQQTWLDYLRGKYIVRYYTATGFTDETHLWLCSNGSFQRSASSGGFGGGASGAFQGGSSGSWTAQGAGENGTLILNYGDGSVAHHELLWDYNENKLYLDGKNWLHGNNESCQ